MSFSEKSNDWQLYKLGNFLLRSYDNVSINDSIKYKRIKIKTKGQGITIRDEVFGIEIGTKNQFRIKEFQFLLSKIDAMNGAFGIVPKACNDGVITGNYWTYNINEDIICKEYLHLLCIAETFTHFSKKASEGTTNRKYLREDKFLNLSIHLPSIQEQKKIVAKIESVKQKIESIAQIREAQRKDILNLLYSKYFDLIKDAKWQPMKKVAPIIRREVFMSENELYPELGIRSFGKGTFHKPAITGLEVGTKKIYQIKEGDLLFSNVFAWEGAIAIAKKEDNDRYGSHRFISCVTNDEVLTEFLCYHFLSEKGLGDINFCSPGGAGRNKTLGLEKLMNIMVPVPDIELQKEFVSLLKNIEVIKQNIVDTDNELVELVPSLLDKAFKGELFSVSETIDTNPIQQEQLVIPESKRRFAKQVLGGKIVSLFKDDKNFTSIKFQKIQYLAEHIIEEDLCWNYYRQTAGPYDNKFMHSVVSNFERNKWFKQQGYKYYPLDKAEEIERYYQNYFGCKSDKLSHLFSLLSNASERFCEAVATIYAVWNNHLIQQLSFDKEKIKTNFFDWSTRKEDIFSEDDFEKAINWMQKNGIIPTGFGQLIKEKK